MWIAGMRRRPTARRGALEPLQDSGAFALEHPYRGRAPEMHELVLAWLLDDDEERPVLAANTKLPAPWPRLTDTHHVG